MRYWDFDSSERSDIDRMLEAINDVSEYSIDPEDLEDDEVSPIERVMAICDEWRGNRGSYGGMIEELDAYLEQPPAIGEVVALNWGEVMAVSDKLFLFRSTS